MITMVVTMKIFLEQKTNMITFNNLGTLGRLANQMFQYASLKGIATNKGFDFCIPPESRFGEIDPLVKDDPLNLYSCFNML